MCMIAHRYLSDKSGKGQNMPNAVLDTAVTRHPDGFGVAWRDPKNGLTYQRFAPQEVSEFRRLLKDIDAQPQVEYVAHFRWATHGPEDRDHAHPYAYEDPDPGVGTVLVFHNGIYSSVTTAKNESDTEVFVRDYLTKLPSRWWENVGIRKLVTQFGGWSKLVLMTADETINMHQYAGEDDGGLWYSSDHRPGPLLGAVSRSGWDWDDNDEEWVRLPDGSWQHNLTSRFAASGDSTPTRNSDYWVHDGHRLTPIQNYDFRLDGDYPLSILCDTCGTAGDVYIVNGRAYVDIPHVASGDALTPTSTALLPSRASSSNLIAKEAANA